MCRVLGVSESGYYRSLRASDKPKRRELLLVRIKEIIRQNEDNDNYGARRIHLALIQEGVKASYSSVYRAMKQNGLIKKPKLHPNGITREDAEAHKSENLIQRNFTAETPKQKWPADITEVPCSDGKLYVAAVLDCFNGEIVGLAMDDNMRKELCIQAFESACKSRNARGMIFHSDRGSQFTSYAFRESLARFGAIQSMSGTGRCYDNARMESFFATLKKEKLYRIRTERFTMSFVKTVIFRYIMIYYNRQRIYTSNPDGWPPAIYRERYLGIAA
ncbi:Transposase InsO and inactivated derivatives [Carboxydocella sporoproducens DSM 16521]|uniref:Transposase InsO and inactivated derivatives n=3 Tax=Clostridiales Family XVI. Incertae Sedis TaxID=543347 RepID=A0A1T4SPY1_9FIRM|nr:Transposase InsO [Carboxydocella thermautotrophica]SKA30213.1 Transposase InsO and inactivated derivatives [Carboxydocella sporoproducens DSM 16521]